MSRELVRWVRQLREDAQPDPAQDIRPEIEWLFNWLRARWGQPPGAAAFSEDQSDQ